MANVRKFTFDLRFDEQEGRGAARPTLAQLTAQALDQAPSQTIIAAPPPPPEPEPEPSGPPLIYTEEEMDIARDEAFVAGHKQAMMEAAAQVEHEVAQALTACANALLTVPPMVEKAGVELHDLAAHVAVEVCQTLLPHTAADYAAREITALVHSLMPNLCSQPRLIIRVHHAMVDRLRGPLAEIAERAGFEGKLSVLDDPQMKMTDARVEWPDGGAERNTSRLWADIDQILQRNIPRFSRGDALDLPLEDTPEEPHPWPPVDNLAWWQPPSLETPLEPNVPEDDGATQAADLPWEGEAAPPEAVAPPPPALPPPPPPPPQVPVKSRAAPPSAGVAVPAFEEPQYRNSLEDDVPLTDEEEKLLAALDERLAGNLNDFDV